jgi:hypothetical protein
MRQRRPQLNGFLDDFGNFVGKLGNSWQGGEDQAMYADPSATLLDPSPATAAGVYNYETAVGSILPDTRKILLTLAGLGIILFSLVVD